MINNFVARWDMKYLPVNIMDLNKAIGNMRNVLLNLAVLIIDNNDKPNESEVENENNINGNHDVEQELC